MNLNGSARQGLASIIIPCWNQLEFTRPCLAALVRHTRRPWELIVVDNGSSDGTASYLAGVQDVAPMPVAIIRNEHNIGFPAAVNQGLKAARGDYLVLLNNDAVVTDGWLDQLIALAEIKSKDQQTTEHTEITEETRTAAHFTDRTTEKDWEGTTKHTKSNPECRPNHGGLRDGYAADPPYEMAEMDGVGTTKNTKNTKGEEGGRIGLVGPMSNYASPPQLVQNVPYASLEEMHAFARRWREERRGQWFTAGKLSGFCLLMKRAVYETIGGLDERFGLGLFDDDDLAERARRAGFSLAVAHDLFVHHFGSRTLQGNGIDAARLLEENGRRFAEKWGTDVGGRRSVSLLPWTGREPQEQTGQPQANGAGHASTPTRRARVSLTMIVRNEEGNLPNCLASVAGVFDEIVVVDTGSTDRTREIAREFGARVFDFVWVNDFAAARNAALARATGDYAFWLDADDVVDPPEREKLRKLLEELPVHNVDDRGVPVGLARTLDPPYRAGDAVQVGGPRADTRPTTPGHRSRAGDAEQAAYVVRCSCDPGPHGDSGQTVVDHIRLFPVREDVRWTYAVHEQILPALRHANVPVRWTDITVRHTGYTDPELRERKLQRDGKILEAELAERPDDPFVLFNLGAIAVERRDWPTAIGYLQQSLHRSDPTASIVRKLYALLARCHQMLEDTPSALGACAAGLRLDPDDAELHFRKAILHRKAAQPAEAEVHWRRILSLKRPEQFCSVDQGIYGHLTLRNLAALAQERGDRAEAQRLWGMVLAECPGDSEATGRAQASA